MRRNTYEVGHESFEFEFYKGKVALNVKCYHSPEPTTDVTKKLWEKLPAHVQDKLSQRAFGNVSAEWWRDAASATSYTIQCMGRSGGWLILDRVDDSYLETLAEEASTEPCHICSLVGAKDHHDAESMHCDGKVPLPFPCAVWDLKCANCDLDYVQHVSLRCPADLGIMYKAHALTNDGLTELKRLERDLDIIRESLDSVPEQLNYELDNLITWYAEGADMSP